MKNLEDKKFLMYSTGQLFKQRQTGGIKRFIELTKYLSDKGTLELCCQDDEISLAQEGLKAAFNIRKPSGKMFSLLPMEARILKKNTEIIKSIRHKKYSAVISFDVPPTVGLCMYKIPNIVLMIRKDLIGYEQTKAKKGIGSKFKQMYMWLCEEFCLRNVKVVIVQCNYDKKRLLLRHKKIAEKIEKKFVVQINNVNPSWVVNKSKDFDEITRDSSLFNICFVGNFDDPRKGHDLLLKVAKQILEKDNNTICFHIIGGGKELESYRNQYENDSIIFYGYQNDPIKILKRCDLAVVPSLADSCPNTIMEALYNAVPVIGSNRGGIPDILENDDALFEPNFFDLEEKLIYYYTSKKALCDLVNQQQARTEKLKFNWNEKIESIIIETI